MVLAAAIVRVVPARRWRSAARGLASLAMRARPGRTRRGESRLARFLGDRSPGGRSHEEVFGELMTTYLEEAVLFAGLGRNRHWSPRLEVHGVERVEAALAAGHGVLLWTAPEIFATTLVRLCARDRGWVLSHLRSWSHGVSGSRVGMHLLNPRRRAVEDLLSRHIPLARGKRTAAVREVSRRLRVGEVVQFHAVQLADRPATVPLFSSRMLLARGAPRVAIANGAALFCVTATREPTDEAPYHLRFEPLLPGGPRERAVGRDDPRIEECSDRFLECLEEALTESPWLWPIQSSQFDVIEESPAPSSR